ncbi:hypothetical protein GCU56_03385 [Geodermatophilus sabuli]|uniref:Heavy-metal-associated domain-containing protein n=1 Tax=Geodermatophilus sabuli TaxID=1564158 RepID=A0A7K3VXT7_9ACTN|nr:hypothetical protein [Geodermatophilus sabuli]NEK56913.1 hypothetical protein [Geodermatophilus sabuli]
MNAPARLAAVALGLVAVFGAAVGVGSLVGPVGTVGTAAAASPAEGHGDDGHESAPAEPPATSLPAGLAVAADGYTLELGTPTAPAGPATEVRFRVLGPDGAPVTAFEVAHEQDLHLVAVRRDLSGFQHVHPERVEDGVWRATLGLTPGAWRLFADFVPAADGENRVLGADLSVPGGYAPEPLPAPSAVAEVDGYTVVLTGDLVPGRESELTLSVSRDGRPVTDLQPYLGSYGHLVVLRSGDLGYLHVHPADGPAGAAPAPGPHVGVLTTAPTAGTYRVFLDFRHGDAVHTAAFTVTTTAPEEAGS